MKKSYIFSFITCVVLISALFIYIQVKLNNLESKVTHHLLVDMGIEKTSISSIKASFGKLPLFSVEVIYKDEPGIRYFYREKEDGQIIQYSHSIINDEYKLKHEELK